MDRDSVEARLGEAIEQGAELTPVPDRGEAPNGEPVEGVEQLPRSRADREPTPGQMELELPTDDVRETRVRALQVEHQLGGAGSRAEELREDERPAERRGELPAIPVQRQRADGLEVPDLGTSAVEPDVGLDQSDPEALGVTQPVEAVPRPVRDDERRCPTARPLGFSKPHPIGV